MGERSRHRRGAETLLNQAMSPGAGQTDSEGSFDEQTWLEVIHRMDEVYSELLENETELERKNAELERSQQFLFSVLSAMSDVLVVCDHQGRVQRVNPAMEQLVGEGSDVLVGRPLRDLLADQASRDRLLTRGVFEHAEAVAVNDCEVNFVDHRGGHNPVAVNCAPLRDRIGRIQGLVLIGRPVGELRQAYHDLSEAHESLKRTQQQLIQSEKLASIGQLVAGVAHELNNPISFVVGNAFALKRYLGRLEEYLGAIHRGVSAEEQQRLRSKLRIDYVLEDIAPLLEGTVEGAERTHDIVDALKRFAAVDRDADQVFDLREVVERSVHWVEKAVSHPVSVVHALQQPYWVRGSQGQMQQVVVNLVSNAVDALQGCPDPVLRISGHVVDGMVELWFHDNGPGIDEEALGRIFDPFFPPNPWGREPDWGSRSALG